MFGQLFRQSPLLVFPLIALACALATFTAVALRAIFGGGDRYRAVADLPLSTDEAAHE